MLSSMGFHDMKFVDYAYVNVHVTVVIWTFRDNSSCLKDVYILSCLWVNIQDIIGKTTLWLWKVRRFLGEKNPSHFEHLSVAAFVKSKQIKTCHIPGMAIESETIKNHYWRVSIVMMSSRRSRDYKCVMKSLLDQLPETPRVTEIVMDFERVMSATLQDVQILGCSFHWPYGGRHK